MIDSGNQIKAKKLVIACGYESQPYISKKIEKFYSTYAIVSEPLPLKELWYQNSFIWETAIPYMYMRTTGDQRISSGGLDDEFQVV